MNILLVILLMYRKVLRILESAMVGGMVLCCEIPTTHFLGLRVHTGNSLYLRSTYDEIMAFMIDLINLKVGNVD